MLLALHGLSDDSSHVRDQILESPVMPTFTSTCSTLLCLSGKSNTEILASITSDDSSALVTQ